MVHASCAVKDCGSSSYIHKNLKFHQFPRFEERCKIWVEACRRPDLVDKSVSSLKNKYLCSLHFEKHMYGRKSLKKTATPTLRLPSDRVNSIYAEIDRTIDTVLYEKHVDISHNRKFLEKPNHEEADAPKNLLEDDITIKEEITDADKNQCRLCLSVNRKMQKVGELTPIYRKLLFENEFQDPLVLSFMYQMLCCWECRAELRRVQRFQDKVRQAHNMFETSQNQLSKSLSNLSTIFIGELKNLSTESNSRPIGVEDCPLVLVVKKEPVEIKVEIDQEETILPEDDPLDVLQDLEIPWQEPRTILELQNELNMQTLSKKTVKILKTTQKVSKRLQNESKSHQIKAKRAKLNQIYPITSRESQNDSTSSLESEMDPILTLLGPFHKIQENEIGPISSQETEREPIASREAEIDQIESQESKFDPIASQESDVDSKSSEKSKFYPKESLMSRISPKASQDSDTETNPDIIFVKVKIEMKELKKILQERRNTESFKIMQYKCESCVLGFTDQNRAEKHDRLFHDEEVGAISCDICSRRFTADSQLSQHYRNHFVKFVCKLCHAQCYTKTGRAVHYKKHSTRTHNTDSIG